MTTIHKIKELLEQKKISAIEITQEILNRLDSNPFGATLCVNREASMLEAKNSQKRLDTGERADLLGIPVMHKDVLVTKEWLTTAGSKFLKNYNLI